MKQIIKRIPGLLILMLVFTACGFQMRGSQSINSVSLTSLNLNSSSANDLSREVRSQLQLAGVEISNGSEITLNLANETYQRTILTVSPNTGKVEEYLLTLTVLMSLDKAGTGDLLRNEMISVSRDFLYDEDALLGKASEENLLKETLRREAAVRIIRRLNAATRTK